MATDRSDQIGSPIQEDWFSKLQTGDDYCFLCGVQSDGITQEHVFPKWLQERFHLWSQRIGLLNDTSIQYRQLLIPCCARCNNEDLSRLESKIALALASGYAKTVDLDEELLYLWVGKLFFGILRKEINLLHDRSCPAEGSIFPAELLKQFSNLHLFLQGIRGAHKFVGDPPYSVLICNLHDVGHPRNYCFRDSTVYMTVALRLGEVGLIVVMEDGGMTKRSFGRYVEKVGGRKLYPIQFDELYAKVTYQVSLVDGGLSYLTSKEGDAESSAQTHVFDGGFVRPWSNEDFSQVLRLHVSDWLANKGQFIHWFEPPQMVPT